MKNSRLSRIEEKRTKKQLFIVLVGIIAILALVFTLGIPLIVGMSVLLGNLRGSQSNSAGSDTTAPVPPVLSTPTQATNSAELLIEGYGESGSTLKIFMNEDEIKKILIGNDGTFTFTDIPLEKGDNRIYATVTDEAGNESIHSQELKIAYKKDGPKLEIQEPQENQEFGKNQQEIQIKGKTDTGSTVTINDRFVSVNDEGNFEYKLKLSDGENIVSIVARDSAGNETKIELKVTYQP